MAVALEPQEELMSSLSSRRTEFRNTFRMKPLNKTDELDGESTATSTSLIETDLLASLKERRQKRRTLLPPLTTPPTNDIIPPTQQENGEPRPLTQLDQPVSGIRKLRALRNRIRETTRFDATPTMPGLEEDVPGIVPGDIPPPSPTLITQRSSHRWRLLSSQLKKVSDKTTEQESFDFFTGSVVTVDNDEGDITDSNREQVDAGGEEEGEESTLIEDERGEVSVQSGDSSPRTYSLTQYALPSYTPFRTRVEREQELYFTPPAEPVPPEHKTPGGVPPVYIEESGMYIGNRPRVNPANQARLENRLLKRKDQGAELWFGDDGLLKVQPDPLLPLVMRPLLLGYEENCQVSYKQIPTSRTTVYSATQNSDGHNEIQFVIGDLCFKHHPLFSVEHVLASDLLQQYQLHQSIDRHKIMDHYRQKLHAMEYAVHNINQSLVGGATDTVEEYQSQLALYLTEMKDIRQQLKQVEYTEYQLVKSIIALWREIKQLRETQQYSSTNIQVTLHKVTTDVHQDEINWERDIQSELNDQRAEFEAGHSHQLQSYTILMNEWAENEQRRRLHPQEGRDSSLEEGAGTEQALPKPVAPPTFNADEVRARIEEGYRGRYRKPGEPILLPHLTRNHPITSQCPREEQLRRNDVSVTKYKLLILYNNKEICSTGISSLNSDFSVSFNDQLRVEVIERPQTIALQVIDCSSLLPSTLTQVFLPTPSSPSSHLLDEYQFSATRLVEYRNHTGVGSGHAHYLLPDHGVLVTEGRVRASVCWGEGPEGDLLATPTHKTGINPISNIHRIKEWIEESHLDPNDPRNFELLDLAKNVSSAPTNEYFRLQAMDSVERFVSDHQFTSDKRFTLLQLREQRHPALKGKSIPLNEESVTESLWKTVQDYQPFALSELPVTIFGDFYDQQRKEREQYLLQIRNRLLTSAGSLSHDQLTLDDVIHEEHIPNLSSLTSSLLELLSPRQPLKPRRKPYHKPKPQNTHVEQCSLSIRIVRAINVPVRDTPTGVGGAGGAGQTEVLVKPFVEVSFGEQSQRTNTAQGPHPHWNEEIIIPFHPPQDDFSPVALQKVTDTLRFDLCDETTMDILQDERQRHTDVHHHIENRWLGVLSIPFSTLNVQPKIEGTFQMTTPPVTMGYRSPASINNTNGVYIQVFITVHPPLGILPSLTGSFNSVEDPVLLHKVSVWLSTAKGRHTHRNYQCTGLDSNGRSVFLSRYVYPQNPPPDMATPPETGVGGVMQSMEKLAWFVSLIPFLPDSLLFSGTCDIWTTSDQFLHMLGGDEEEHAVLLCNYFLHIGQEAWVVLGRAIPEGPTAYVLTVGGGGGSPLLWDPSSGRHYTTTQSHVPLISIGTVFNRHNVWANVQEWDSPGQMSFDFSNSSDWLPVLPLSTEPLPTVQVETLNYLPTNSNDVQGLQSRIDEIIRRHIESLRVRHLTKWNTSCSRKIQRTLHKFEECPFTCPQAAAEHKQDLMDTLPGYKLHGYPLNLKCCNTQELTTSIEHTAIHLCEQGRAEFALGVHIHSYSNNILSLWIYLMTLVPNNLM